jgi:hypothetical protein
MPGHQNQIIKSRANSYFCGLKELRDSYTPESNADFWCAALSHLQAEGLLPKWLSCLISVIKMHSGAVSVLAVPCSVAAKQPHVCLFSPATTESCYRLYIVYSIYIVYRGIYIYCIYMYYILHVYCTEQLLELQ